MKDTYTAGDGWTLIPAEGETLPNRFRVRVGRGVVARWRADLGPGTPFGEEDERSGETYSASMTNGSLEISAPKGTTLNVILG